MRFRLAPRSMTLDDLELLFLTLTFKLILDDQKYAQIFLRSTNFPRTNDRLFHKLCSNTGHLLITTLPSPTAHHGITTLQSPLYFNT